MAEPSTQGGHLLRRTRCGSSESSGDSGGCEVVCEGEDTEEKDSVDELLMSSEDEMVRKKEVVTEEVGTAETLTEDKVTEKVTIEDANKVKTKKIETDNVGTEEMSKEEGTDEDVAEMVTTEEVVMKEEVVEEIVVEDEHVKSLLEENSKLKEEVVRLKEDKTMERMKYKGVISRIEVKEADLVQLRESLAKVITERDEHRGEVGELLELLELKKEEMRKTKEDTESLLKKKTEEAEAAAKEHQRLLSVAEDASEKKLRRALEERELEHANKVGRLLETARKEAREKEKAHEERVKEVEARISRQEAKYAAMLETRITEMRQEQNGLENELMKKKAACLVLEKENMDIKEEVTNLRGRKRKLGEVEVDDAARVEDASTSNSTCTRLPHRGTSTPAIARRLRVRVDRSIFAREVEEGLEEVVGVAAQEAEVVERVQREVVARVRWLLHSRSVYREELAEVSRVLARQGGEEVLAGRRLEGRLGVWRGLEAGEGARLVTLVDMFLAIRKVTCQDKNFCTFDHCHPPCVNPPPQEASLHLPELQGALRPLALRLLASLGAAGRGAGAEARAAARTTFHFAIIQVNKTGQKGFFSIIRSSAPAPRRCGGTCPPATGRPPPSSPPGWRRSSGGAGWS